MTSEPFGSQTESKTRIKIGNWVIYVWRRDKSAFFDWKLAEIDQKSQDETTVMTGYCKKPGYEQAIKEATRAINVVIKARQRNASRNRELARIWLGEGATEKEGD